MASNIKTETRGPEDGGKLRITQQTRVVEYKVESLDPLGEVIGTTNVIALAVGGSQSDYFMRKFEPGDIKVDASSGDPILKSSKSACMNHLFEEQGY